MKKLLLALSCVVGFTACEMEHHEHKAPTPPPAETQPTPDTTNNPNLNR